MESDKSTNFFELDIRVGKIIKAEIFEEAKKPAYKLTIDFGDLIGTKKTSAQITNYKLDELQEKPCIAVINLGNKRIGLINGPICLFPRFITAIQVFS